jgi:hypothetical protein
VKSINAVLVIIIFQYIISMVSGDRINIIEYYLILTLSISFFSRNSSVLVVEELFVQTALSCQFLYLLFLGQLAMMVHNHLRSLIVLLVVDGMNFSPPTRMVRTPPFGTPAISVRTNGGNFTPVSELTGSTGQTARESLMLRAYSDTVTTYNLTSYDQTAIKDTVSKHVVSIVKFVKSERAYPSFWMPNLLQDPPSYVNAFFDYYGNKYKDRKTNEACLVEATRLWKAAAPKIKKHIDNHCAGVAQKMKADILPGLLHLATRNGDAAEDVEFFKMHPIYDKQVLDGLQSLFEQYALSSDYNKLAKIRIENIDAFQAFAVLCLRHTISVMTWRVKHRKFKLTDIFSISDEGIALVILENNAKVWKE